MYRDVDRVPWTPGESWLLWLLCAAILILFCLVPRGLCGSEEPLTDVERWQIDRLPEWTEANFHTADRRLKWLRQIYPLYLPQPQVWGRLHRDAERRYWCWCWAVEARRYRWSPLWARWYLDSLRTWLGEEAYWSGDWPAPVLYPGEFVSNEPPLK